MWVNFHICLLCSSSNDETTAELSFLWSGVRSQFLLFTAAHPAVCVCAIKKLNRNRRQYFFLIQQYSYCCGSCDVKEEKMKVSQNRGGISADATKKIIYYARERVRAR
jgi:hypothetical protein